MHVEERVWDRATDTPDHVWPHGEIGDEVAVHDVYVEQVGASLEDRAAVGRHIGEISGED
jgi:hypothetical protein